MNISKYSSLQNAELLTSKMAKTDVIEDLNLEIYNVLKNLHQNTPRASMFLIMTSYKP